MSVKLPTAALFLLLLWSPGCGSGTAEGSGHALSAIDRSGDPRLLEARAALGAGRPASAASLLASVGIAAGVEGPLCLARVRLAAGDVVGALSAVEEARLIAPEDPRVFATAAEVLALCGRGGDAEDELVAGAAFGEDSPDLERARALLDLTRPGQGPMALARLEAALAADPGLPYCDWPLAQAHLLTGRAALGAGQPDVAVAEARAALALEPDLATAEELLGSALVSIDDFVGGLAALERAQDMGLDVGRELADVHMRAAMAARLLSMDDVAIEHYLAARELGLSEEELGSGSDLLYELARAEYEAATTAMLADKFVDASKHFARSIELGPEGPLALEARDGLAGARFRLEDYPGAALAWSEVQLAERAAGDGAASRTHMNMARARVLSGNYQAARELLEQYLELYPEGEAAAETKDLLARVPGQ